MIINILEFVYFLHYILIFEKRELEKIIALTTLHM
jgi:hypothetical protein